MSEWGIEVISTKMVDFLEITVKRNLHGDEDKNWIIETESIKPLYEYKTIRSGLSAEKVIRQIL